ncbi:triacylglycerol esterase/lipase EstA [Haloferula helveola]|uniref:Triacylglycerol esterase/lipase EstA n=1 Tax=Haloferula helveola TaxID=490095 RepID=A0ABM7RJ39_9BACT|nr:triacylglycerol esterase/lipase EstA [Haloferula helveola]
MFRSLFALLAGITTVSAAEPAPRMTRAVLVHGIWQGEGRCFGFLRHDLESRGVECLVPSLKPADGRDGLEPMAKQLDTEIRKAFGPDESFVLIAFSMGGLVSRHYLQDLGGAGRCESFITISTPHHGTEMAKFHYGRGAAEMRPGSVFLRDLQLGQSRLGDIPLVSYRTPMDAVIVPSESSVWDRAENVEIPCPLHPLMTASLKLRKDVLRRFSYPGR